MKMSALMEVRQYVLTTLWFITIGCRGHRHYLIKVNRVLVTLQTVFSRGHCIEEIVSLVQETCNTLKFKFNLSALFTFYTLSRSFKLLDIVNW